jgi:hypothetical protein
MDKKPCNNSQCPEDGHPQETYIDLFGHERERLVYAPNRDYEADPPQFRVHPISGFVPNVDIDHCGIGNTLKHYVGQEEVVDAAVEYRRSEGDVWLDADNPGRPAYRQTPPLTPAQVADLTRDRPDLADVPYGEPLVFLALNDFQADFWGRAVAAGWAPTQQDVQLLLDARTLLDYDTHPEDDRA